MTLTPTLLNFFLLWYFMDLGSTIKHLRKQKGLSQGKLSEMSGISQTYLSQIESNSKSPILSTIQTICDCLNIPMPILFFMSMEKEDVHQNKRKAFETLSPSIKSLINGFFSV